MKRKVNECGEHTRPLWLCVPLISSLWEAVWGRDGAYYCYGTLRTPCEALFLGCLLCGQQHNRYKHSAQHLKRNHYPNKKTRQRLNEDHYFNMFSSWRSGTLSTFVVLHTFSSSSIPFPPTHIQRLLLHPSSLNLLFSQFYVLPYMFYTLFPPSPSLCVVSFLAVCVRNLVGGRHEEHSHVSQRELREMNEMTLHAFEKEGGKEQ